MFERYTEVARRVIFFARYEASVHGSRTIETEHLLLGLLREDKKLLQRLLERPDVDEEMRARIKSRIPSREKISTSIDLPLSDECKRILGYADDESERLHHRLIGTEHLFLGILREKGCLAAEVLSSAGINLEAARKAVSQSSPPERPLTANVRPAVDDLSIRELVDKLPEDRLRRFKAMIEKLLGGQPEYQTEERASSVRRSQDGSIVVETRQSIGPHQVSVKEQFQLSSDGKKLRYAHEVTGPRPEQRHAQSYEFDLFANS